MSNTNTIPTDKQIAFVLDALRENNGSTIKEITTATGLHRSVVSGCMSLLAGRGDVVGPQGQRQQYFARSEEMIAVAQAHACVVEIVTMITGAEPMAAKAFCSDDSLRMLLHVLASGDYAIALAEAIGRYQTTKAAIAAKTQKEAAQ